MDHQILLRTHTWKKYVNCLYERNINSITTVTLSFNSVVSTRKPSAHTETSTSSTTAHVRHKPRDSGRVLMLICCVLCFCIKKCVMTT